MTIPLKQIQQLEIANPSAFAAFSSTGMQPGALMFVACYEDYFQLVPGTALTPTANAIYNDASGNQWARLYVNSLVWAAQPTWYVDPANASGTAADTNNGLTSATALRTLTELLARVAPKGLPWLIFANTTLNVMSDTPANTDLVSFTVESFAGASFTWQTQVAGGVNGFRAVTAPSTFTAVANVNRAIVGAGVLTSVTDAVNTGNLVTANDDLLIWNATRSTYSWIRAQPGGAGTVTTTSPQTLPALGSVPTIVANVIGDTYQVLAPVKVNVARFAFTSGAGAASGAAGKCRIIGVWFAGNTFSESVEITTDRFSVFLNTLYLSLPRFDAALQASGNLILENIDSKTLTAIGANSNNLRIYGGQLRGFTTIYPGSLPVADGDVIFDSLNVIGGFLGVGSICVQTTMGCASVANSTFPGCISVRGTGFYAGLTPIVWGAGTCVVGTGSSVLNGTANSFASTFTLASAFTFAGQSTGAYWTRGAGGGYTNTNVTTSFANVDSSPSLSIVDPVSNARVAKAA